MAHAILNSVDFDPDHLWCFRLTNRFGAKIEIRSLEALTGEDDELAADKFKIGELQIKPGEAMIFLFDFGDSWEFTVLLEKIDVPVPKQKEPKLIEKHGQAPEQYPDWDED